MTTATPTRTAEAPAGGAETSMYDVVVIGGGPGGYVAAIRAAQLGLRAAVVEREALGGICLNWGCIPSKALLRSAEVLTLINHARDFGITVGGVEADYAAALKRCQGIVDKQVKGVAFLMRKNKIDVHMGTGRIRGRRSGDRTRRGWRGADAADAERDRGHRFPCAHHPGCRDQRPRGGQQPRGMEHRRPAEACGGTGRRRDRRGIATVFNAYGCDVTIVEMLPRIVPLEDKDNSEMLRRAFTRRGIKILTETKVDRVEVADGAAKIHVVPAATRVSRRRWRHSCAIRHGLLAE